MSLLLNIDTATETAFVSIADKGLIIASQSNASQKDHAAFLQVAVRQLAQETGIHLSDIAAVAVAAGPGSYTGLRVGMSGAKGICYALNKPLITLNTLEILANGILLQNDTPGTLLCPMIDARRMEVFTAVYDHSLNAVLDPCAMVLTEDSFKQLLQEHSIVFFGNGAAKWQQVCQHQNASFATVSNAAAAMAHLSHQYFTRQQFADLAYSEPFYLKEFQDKI
ncbi:tRNA (adenosine(37)-N6)-threonylcarbamoyltransferase complex dimerization subunit type 1 TsaB [Ferruginibacter sp.]